MGQQARISQDLQRPNGMSELELLRTITGGFASFGNAVRLSDLSNEQKSRVLSHLADASRRMVDATNAYLFELAQVKPKAEAAPPAKAAEATRAEAAGTQAVAAALLVAG